MLGGCGDGGGFGDDPGCSVLNQLKFLDGFVGETEEQGVAIINAAGDENEDQDGGRVIGEGGTEMVDIL